MVMPCSVKAAESLYNSQGCRQNYEDQASLWVFTTSRSRSMLGSEEVQTGTKRLEGEDAIMEASLGDEKSRPISQKRGRNSEKESKKGEREGASDRGMLLE